MVVGPESSKEVAYAGVSPQSLQITEGVPLLRFISPHQEEADVLTGSDPRHCNVKLPVRKVTAIRFVSREGQDNFVDGSTKRFMNCNSKGRLQGKPRLQEHGRGTKTVSPANRNRSRQPFGATTVYRKEDFTVSVATASNWT